MIDNIVLVCGGRQFNDDVSCLEKCDIDILIHGGCRGADKLAAQWAHSKGIHTAEVQALWKYYDKSAGYKRNKTMLLLKPTLCIAFPGGKGTNNMIKLCQENNISVWQPYDEYFVY